MGIQEFPDATTVYSTDATGIDELFYGADGDPICYQNGTAYFEDDDGYLYMQEGLVMNTLYWKNSTNQYFLYTKDGTSGELRNPIREDEQSFDMLTGLGFIAVIAAIMFIVSFVGMRIFGGGLSDVSVSTIVKGTLLITMWGVFSVMSYTALGEIPAYLGGVFYFILTVMYAVGIVQQIGGGGS